jgi:hypothetical protein
VTLRYVLPLAAVAFAVRALLFFFGPWADAARAISDDSHRYITLAENLRSTGTFAKRAEDGLVHTRLLRLRRHNGTAPAPNEHGLLPEVFRTPFYPAFLALCRLASPDLRLALAAQCLLSVLTTCLVFQIARALGIPDRGAACAALLWAIHPGLAVFDCMAVTESLFGTFVVVAVWLACVARGWSGWALCGVVLGLSTLIRPLGLLYLPCCLLFGWHRRSLGWRPAGFLVALAVIPPVLWAGRNHRVGEGFRLTTVGEVNLLFYAAAYSRSEERGEDWLRSWPARVDEYADRLEGRLRPGEDVFAAARALGIEEISSRPVAVLRMFGKSTCKMMVDHSLGEVVRLMGREYRPSGLFSRFVLREKPAPSEDANPLLILVAFAWSGLNAAVALAALIGGVRLVVRRQVLLVAACCITIGLFVLATFSVGLERMRLPVLLPLFLLAVCAGWPPPLRQAATDAAAPTSGLTTCPAS